MSAYNLTTKKYHFSGGGGGEAVKKFIMDLRNLPSNIFQLKLTKEVSA